MSESYVIRKERCPECAKLGKDQSGDNLAVYSDGHSYCYSCGWGQSTGILSGFRKRISSSGRMDKQESGLYLPEDCDVNYPRIALDWIEQYELTRNDLLNNNVLWSDSNQRLIFPVYATYRADTSGLIAYQGRYFGPPAPEGTRPYPKWYGKGDLKNTFNILGRSQSNKLILTEDIISAIKCSKFAMAMPLYGCSVGIIRFKRLRMLIEPSVEVCLYLDPDKRSESLVEARRGNMVGLKCRTIFSDKDPKEESYIDLERILTT